MINAESLPIYNNKELIIQSIVDNRVIIVESPTGSGKTTQIPLILKDAGFSSSLMIGVTQPRRIATMNVCDFINKQLSNEKLPQSYCAYKMRFWDTTDSDTKIKILTDGMLLQELKTDPLLSQYSIIMIDEAHERSLNIDLILGLLKRIIVKRNDFKVIISSATINTSVFSEFFKINGVKAPIISIKAKKFHVDVKYFPLKKQNDLKELCNNICRILNILIKNFKKSHYKESNDILVFLPGELEIKEVNKSIFEFCDYNLLEIYPLYGRLSKEEQEKVFITTSVDKMKVVLATNIAETSLTIDGIKTVIDSGLCRMNFYNQFDFTSSLITKEISSSSALQRTGRAGRTADGTCYRLYTEENFRNKTKFSQEEILRTDLSEVVLRMVDLGIFDIENFDFLTRPGLKSIQSAIKTLIQLGAIKENRELTGIGELMVKFPLSPRLSRCLVQAIIENPDFVHPVCICISFLSCKSPFLLPDGEEDAARYAHSKFTNKFGDFISYQYLYKKYFNLNSKEEKEKFCNLNFLDYQSMEEIVHVVQQLCDIVKTLGFVNLGENITNYEFYAKETLKCLLTGLIQFVCINKKGSVYKTVTADEIFIHPGSSYFRKPPKYLLAGEIVMTSKTYARTVSPLEEDWIKSINPKLLTALNNKKLISDETKTDKVISKKQICIYGNYFPAIDNIAIIPYENLYTLLSAYKKASRHPNKLNAAILYKEYYIGYGQKLREIVEIAFKLKDLPFAVNSTIPKKTIYQDSFKILENYLDLLMGLRPLDKYKNRLGFVELITSKNGVFFHVNASFTEALNNTAYSLLNLYDYTGIKDYRNTYNRIVRLLD